MADALYRGTYQTRKRRLVRMANANPYTTCWRCGLRLDEHPPHRSGRPVYWTAGHLIDGNPNSPLAPEASTCNYTAGAVHGEQLRRGNLEPRTNIW